MSKLYSHIAGLILLFIAGIVNGQYISNDGNFEVDFIKGCAPFTINLTSKMPDKCPCDIRWGDGTQGQNVYQHTYTAAGSYRLEVDHQGFRGDFIDIVVVDNIKPDFDINTCSSNEVTLQINDASFDQYQIDYNNDGINEFVINRGNPVPVNQYVASGAYQISVSGLNLNAADNCASNVKQVNALPALPTATITSISITDKNSLEINYQPQPNIAHRLEISPGGTSSFQLLAWLDESLNTYSFSSSSIDLEKNYYCFRIGSYDACNNTSVYSGIVCSIDLSMVNADGLNQLNWNASPGATNYSVCKNGTCDVTTVQPSHTDIDIICETTYCYTVSANFPNGATSSSMEYCGLAFSTQKPPVIEDISIRVSGSQIEVNWFPPAGFTPTGYDLRHKYETESPYLFPTITETTFIDLDISPSSGQYCYTLDYSDICGNRSGVGPEVCAVFLTGSLQADNSVSLSWTPYAGYMSGVQEYRIEKYDQAGGLQDTFTTTSTQFLDDKDVLAMQVVQYKIYAIPVDGVLPASSSNLVTIIRQSDVIHPDAFTPNGDGLNDDLFFYGRYIKTFKVKIYNRWGELVFSTDRIDEGWDGTYLGRPMPTGGYAFKAEVTDQANQNISIQGMVGLILN
ncbi:MAG: gliding motility-associated C-terminal domain-containing protein [Cyclobacteriaceae bacterium]|nr:gliding motility-associated C-terminal domain-containing protein [Cyclobacteriaceae bacterium]